MKVVITATDFPDADIERAILEDAGHEVVVTDVSAPHRIANEAADADALLVQFAIIDRDTISQLPKLQFISRYGVGVDNIDLEAAFERNIRVANVPSYGGDEVALHATSLILALIRHLPGFDRCVRAGQWNYRDTGPVAASADMTLGLLGLGRIGRTVAERAGVWFRQVIAHDPHVIDEGAVDLVGLDELFARADVVSVHVPLTSETAGSVDRRRMRLLGPGGYLVNTARGAVVRLDDLLEALDAGELRAAALDVQPHEPPPPSHPILRHPAVLLTPHVAWYSESAEADLRRQAARNVVAWQRGKPENLCR
ncbi:C-terminal binding protein [Egicoccus sp. AB-alg6-2]|uniref:C-terminal binding protein n=1 Tax=Egicoccus sp. AB-alg6-2 TaxID=3242692 RepID=UPI00359EFC22